MTGPIEKVLDALRSAGCEPKPTGKAWASRCPAHDDHNPSLSTTEGKDGRALIRCHAGCSTVDVVAALGLTMANLMPEHSQTGNCSAKRWAAPRTYPTARDAVADLERRRGPRSCLWTYHDAEGEPVGVVVRWDRPGDGKDYRPISRNGSGWSIGGMAEPRPLYHLPDLLRSEERVYVGEGEKVADAIRSLGLTATTSPHGSKSPQKTDWTPLAGKDVGILSDNDDSGRKYAETVAAILAKLRPIPVVRIVELPDLPPGGDMVEFIAARRAAGLNDEAIRAEIEALTDAVPVFEPTTDESQSIEEGSVDLRVLHQAGHPSRRHRPLLRLWGCCRDSG